MRNLTKWQSPVGTSSEGVMVGKKVENEKDELIGK